jgi:RNA polymerase sigma-70 factor (ECF subfamily)
VPGPNKPKPAENVKLRADDRPEAKQGAAATALQRLVDEFGGQLYSLGLRFCGNRQDAEDLVQEVFLQAFRAWGSFEGRSSPKTWLYTIAGRACQRMHRPRAGEPARIGSLEELLPFGEPRIAAIAAEQDDSTQTAIRKEARERVEQAIASLPDVFRVPLILKEIVGLTVPEVADILGLEEGTVKSRVHRARLRIRAEIDKALPRQVQDAPPPAYPLQVYFDLLNAKQEALDRGVPFDQAVICDRCRSVFSSLDLTQEVCRELAAGSLPESLRQRLSHVLKPQ